VALVQHGREGRRLLAPLDRSTAGHDGFPVPAQTLGHLAQRLGLALECQQLGQSPVPVGHRVPLMLAGIG
jgi:hypothetical protein